MTESLILKLVTSSEVPDLESCTPAGVSVKSVEPLFPDASPDELYGHFLVAEVSAGSKEALSEFIGRLNGDEAIEYAEVPASRELLAD